MTLDADLLLRIRQIWEAARTQAARSVNTAHVAANWLIGQQIVEAEQGGSDRAVYGTRQLELLSAQLTADYGSGFSVTSLGYMRQFYVGYPGLLQIPHALRGESDSGPVDVPAITNALRSISTDTSGTEWRPGRLHPALSWTHYRALLNVGRTDVRAFYEIEAVRNG